MRGVGSLTLLGALLATPASARDALGIFDSWGVFRDDRPARCFAIAEPIRQVARNAPWRPFAAVSHWPARGVRGQFHVRLRQAKGPNVPVYLTIGDQRFQLVAGGADAWAPDVRHDASIIAAMRSGTGMRVETRGADGVKIVEEYRLRGAATAIDAAALACARARPAP